MFQANYKEGQIKEINSFGRYKKRFGNGHKRTRVNAHDAVVKRNLRSMKYLVTYLGRLRR
jgi:hypothetical protein